MRFSPTTTGIAGERPGCECRRKLSAHGSSLVRPGRRPVVTHNRHWRGVALMMMSAVLAAGGQLLWKFGAQGGLWMVIFGLLCYGMGAVLMILAYRCGEVSALQPILASGYVLSVALGAALLHEPVTATKVAAVILITGGVVLIAGDRPIRGREDAQ